MTFNFLHPWLGAGELAASRAEARRADHDPRGADHDTTDGADGGEGGSGSGDNHLGNGSGTVSGSDGASVRLEPTGGGTAGVCGGCFRG